VLHAITVIDHEHRERQGKGGVVRVSFQFHRGGGWQSPTQGITNKRINSLSPPPALRSTLQLLAALSARVMEVPRLARSTGFPSTESGLEGTPALCTRAPPHGAPSLRHTGRETRPRDAAAPHTSPPGSLVCIGVGQHVVVNAAVALAALPVPWHRRVGVERNERKPILPGIFI
jgi:hypothetical protein